MIGVIISLPSPDIAEALSRCGFDWLFIDMEHGSIDFSVLSDLLRAAQPATPCAIRIPAIDEVWTKRCLDLGADGLIVPQIRTPEEAHRIVRWSKYPPQGERSVGIARAHGYGAAFTDYVARANDDVAVILQVEHIEAIRQIDSLLSVAGVDAVFVGPYDLSASMGRIGQVDDPEVTGAVDRVREASRAAGMPTGIFAPSIPAARAHASSGDTLLAVGIDIQMLAEAAVDRIASLG